MANALKRTAETVAVLSRENEVRRARIRRIRLEIAQRHAQECLAASNYIEAHGDLPPRGWNEASTRSILALHDELNRLAYEIASLSAGPGYLVMNAVGPGDVQRVLEGIQ